MKLIVPMAGRGTRVRPHSHVTPKPLLSVKGRSIVERIVDTFARVLPEVPDEGVFVLGPDFGQEIRDQLTQICEARDMTANFAVQRQAEGTAHAVGCAGDHLEGDGIVVFADTLFEINEDVDLGDSDVVVWVKEVDDPSRFGVAVRDGEEGFLVPVRDAEALARTPEVTAVQYTPGAGSPSALAVLDMLRMLQEAGKPIVVDAPPDELPELASVLDPRGVMFLLPGVDQAIAERAVKVVGAE